MKNYKDLLREVRWPVTFLGVGWLFDTPNPSCPQLLDPHAYTWNILKTIKWLYEKKTT